MKPSSKRTLAATYVAAAGALALVAYYRFANHHLLAAVMFGVFAGALVPLVVLRGEAAPERQGAMRRPHVFDLLVVAGGVAVIIYGITTARAGVVVSGLPLIGLGVGLFVIRSLVWGRRPHK
jgi:hypothetical protein